MFYQHAIDPIALSLGPLDIRWYGIMYLISFLSILWYGHWRIRRFAFIPWTDQQWSDSLIWFVVGVIVGGRAGYVFFYGFSDFLSNPLSLFFIWEGGMSFHGGAIGVTSAMFLYERKHKQQVARFCDFVTPMIPIGLFFGRLGNFIGGELWGKPTDVPWAVIFPAKNLTPRHPSQLYEMFLEGLVLFIVLGLFSMKARPRYTVSGMFLAGYGLSRILVEFVREPDAHLGYLAFGFVTMGQVLSLPMLIIGSALIVYGYSLAEPVLYNARTVVAASADQQVGKASKTTKKSKRIRKRK